MEFSVQTFSARLYDLILESNQFPYMRDSELDRAKHPKRSPLHLKEAIRQNTIKYSSGDIETFDIGNEALERSHPYYHILEQAPVIRKRNRGTKKTKGSQAKIEDVGKRDYERVTWNGKTFSKEYSRNVRGMRRPSKNVTLYGNGFIMNRDADAYQNIHYKYIDKILDDIIPIIASEFGLKIKRTINAGLDEEYDFMSSIIDTFDTHILGE